MPIAAPQPPEESLEPATDSSRDRVWHRFELQLANIQSVSKAQSVLVHTLGVFLAVVWGWKYLSVGGEVTVQMLGMTVRATGFWQIVPAAVAILNLALLGAINVIDHAWTRVNESVMSLGEQSLFAELDTHKNFLDYVGYLSLWSKPVLPVSRTEQRDRFQVELLLYPALVAAAIYTTAHAWWELALTPSNSWYVAICVGLQLASAFQFVTSKLLAFFGLKVERNGLLMWDPKLREYAVRWLKRAHGHKSD